MRKIYPVLFFLLYSLHSRSQDMPGPRITAMGNAGVALHQIWSINSNAAGLAQTNRAAIAVGYENKYSIKELSSKSAIVVIPLKILVLGASFTSYGNGVYTISKSKLSLAKKFGPKLYTAITFNYHQIKIENYGNEHTFSVDAGIQVEALPHLWIGAHVANPNQSHFDHNSSALTPAHIRFGSAYHFSDKLTISNEIEKTLSADLDFKLGLEYRLIKALSLRGGVSVNIFKQYGGLGLTLKTLKIDFSVSSHPVLGYSPQIALGYDF